MAAITEEVETAKMVGDNRGVVLERQEYREREVFLSRMTPEIAAIVVRYHTETDTLATSYRVMVTMENFTAQK